MALFSWLNKHKFLLLVLFIIAYFLSKSLFGVSPLNLGSPVTSVSRSSAGFAAMDSVGLSKTMEYAPQPDVENRLVIQESNLSLLVKDVTDTRNKIVSYANTSGGYMVSSSLSNPQDAPVATVIIRVSSDKLDETLNFFRSLSVKVVSENLIGRDVTDQYMDMDTRLATMTKTKSRYESILAQATLISDIQSLTQQIISIESQIDSLRGRQNALEQNAKLAKLTLYLSTDEIALPYAPNDTFRPAVIFKLAVRSLVSTLRGLATMLIWIAVYSVIILPVIGLIFFIKRLLNRNKK